MFDLFILFKTFLLVLFLQFLNERKDITSEKLNIK